MVVCMAAPVSPRFRRNKEKPANGLEPHSKIRRRRVTRSESQESHQTKKIPKELALAMGHGLAEGGEQEVSLEERIKAIVIGNQKEIPRHFLDQDMRSLCSTVELEEWIRKSFTNKNSVKSSNATGEDLEPEGSTGTKGANLKKKEHSEPKISYSERRTSQTTKIQVDNEHYSERLREQQLYSRSQTSTPRKGISQNSICKHESRQRGVQSSSHPKTIAQTSVNACDRKSADTVRHPSNNRNDNGIVKKKSSRLNSREDLVNITDSEKILYKLRSSSIVRHKSLHNPRSNCVMLLPDPRSDRGRSDDVLQRSLRSRSESRILEKDGDSQGSSNSSNDKGDLGISTKRMPETTAAAEKTDNDKPDKPNSPGSSKIVRKKSTLSRNKTDLFRAAKEHPSSISRLKEKFAKFSAVAYQRKLSNQLSMSRKKKSRASESVEGGLLENSVLQSAKEFQSTCRIAECPSDSKPNSQTPNDRKPNHPHTPRRQDKACAKDFQRSDLGDINHNHSRTPIKGEKTDADQRASQTASESGGEGTLVLRQCLIGANLAFGLVQLKTSPNGNSHSDGHGLVTIRMRPDDEGRFGFNVKGGADQGMPIIVSRVAPGTPADIAIPRLNEGDQVLFINGRDVSQHTHEQVVMFIRASRETHSGELVLIVRPNVYVGEEGPPEEPNLEYLPENYQIIAPQGTGTNALEASLMLLQESLDSGAALAQFEQLYRKKPGMTMNAARLDINIAKNRYRDISPYDQTRVILKEQNVSGGDYINANYVNMEIPGSGIVNRYIAAQGPLPKTCTDFWQMVWEQHSSLVVMLTTKVEKGRVKCHQYWPEMYETMDYGLLQITCVKEEETPSFAFREFNLTHVETSEERHISHMQYIAWPDHNVPDDPADFLEFVLKVRQRRMGMVEPTVVHCSAGIGRTGVLITMETAMCLIEANQPVYPLSIVRQMRDQRAMLIQTATQYKFVCEAILKVYNEELVKPLEDYQR